MNKHLPFILIFIGCIGFFSLAIYISYMQFTHPDMTETRLFMTYWKEILCEIGFAIIVGVGIKLKGCE